MGSWRARTRPAAAALPMTIGIGLWGCQAVQMKVPDSLESAEVLPVTGGGASGALVDEQLSFGPYHVHEIHRQWTGSESGASSLGPGSGASRTKTQSGFSFMMTTSAGLWRGVCNGRASQTDVTVGNVSFTPSASGHFHCVCASQQGPGRAELWLGGGRYSLHMGDSLFPIIATGDYQAEDGSIGSRSAVTGYVLNTPEGDLAAVDVCGAGVVYLGRALAPTDRDGFACAAAALLLTDD